MANDWTPPSDGVVVNKGSSFVPPSDAAELKKKDLTVSGSVKPSSERLSTTTTTKPTVSSYSKGKPDGIYSFPGEENAIYKKENGEWFKSFKNEYKYYPITKGDVQERINSLEKNALSLENYSFEKPEPKIPEIPKELEGDRNTVEYWNKLLKAGKINKKTYDYHADRIASSDLEKSFVKAAAPKPKITASDKAQQKLFETTFEALDLNDPEYLRKKAESDKIDKSLSLITGDFVNDNEEDVVPSIERIIKDYPYLQVSESGMGYDELRIVNSVTGEDITVNLENWTSNRDNEEANILRGFLDVQMNSKEYVNQKEKVDKLQAQINVATPTERINLSKKLLDEKAKLNDLSSLRYNYAKNDKYKSSAIYDKNAKDNIKTEFAKIQIQTIDYSERLKSYNEWNKTVNEARRKGLITEDQYNTEYAPKLDAERNMLIDENKNINNQIIQAKDKSVSIDNIAANEYAVQAERGNVLSGTTYSLLQGAENSLRFLLETGDFQDGEFKGLLTQAAPGSISDVYTSAESRNAFEQIIFGLANSGGSALVGAAAGAPWLGLYASSYVNMKDQMSTPEFANVPEYQKMLMSGVYGATIGLLEAYGVSKWFTKSPAGKGLTNWILKKTITELGKDASAELIELTIKKNLGSALANGLIQVTSAGIVEGSTELTQEAADMVYKDVFNRMSDKEYFQNPKTWAEVADRLSQSFILGFAGGSGMQSITQTTQVGLNELNKAQINNITNLIESPELKDTFRLYLKDQIISGNISKDEAKRQIDKINQVEGVLNKIPSKVDKFEAFKLITERDELQKEIAGKDPALVAAQTERVNAINDELKQLSYAVQEQATSEVPVQPEARVGGEVAQGEPETRPEEVTQEGEQEKVTAQINVAPLFDTKVTNVQEAEAIRNSEMYQQYKKDMTDAAKQFGVEVDAIDDTIGGYAGTSEVSTVVNVTGDWNNIIEFAAAYGAMAPEVQDSTIAGRTVEAQTTEHNADRFDIGIDNQEAALKAAEDAGFSQDGFTMSGDKIMFFNIFDFPVENFDEKYATFVDKYIEYGGKITSESKSAVQSEFIDSFRRAEILTEAERNAVQQTGREGVRDVIKKAKERNFPYIVAKAKSDQINLVFDKNIDEVIKNQDTKTKQDLAKNAKLVMKAIPGVKIYLHNNTAEYNGAVGEETDGTERGSFIASDGAIHINMQEAFPHTLLHEAFHYVILNKGIDGKTLNSWAKSLKSIIKDKKLLNRIDDLLENYSAEEQAEEFISELGGIMGAAKGQLTTSALQKFKTLINKIAKAIGLPPIFTAASTTQDAIDFINTISKQLVTGDQIITEGYQSKIVSTDMSRKKQVKVTENQKLTFVKQSDIIDFKSLVDDIVSKDQTVWFWVADQLGRGMYFDSELNGEHYLDAGPSYALDPENRKNGIIWASGKSTNELQKLVNNSDYIFIISGSPEQSKLFNKTVSSLIKNRIESKVKFDEFKSNLLNAKPTKAIKEILEKYNSYDEIFLGIDRKKFIIAINEQKTKETPAKKLLDSYGAFVDPNELRDGFFKDNNFDMGDVMLVLKPTGVGNKANHSTYENNVLGEVIGVPDIIVNSYDILPEDVRNKYRDDLTKTQQQQVVAPYGIGTKKIQQVPERKKQLIQRTDKASEKLQQLFQRENMPLTIQEAKEIVGEVIDWTTWYDGLSTYVDGIFGEYAEDVLSLLPLASMAANSVTTVSLAISNAERIYQGEMPKGVAEYYGYISDFLQGKGIKSDKMSNFFKALTGDKDAIAVDSHVWSIIMWKNPNKKQVNPKNQAEFEKAKDFVRTIADELGLSPREVQAALWAANILRTGERPDSYEEYFKKQLDEKGLKQRIETWRNKGYQPFSEIRKEREAGQTTGRKKQLVYNASPRSVEELGKRSGVVYFATDKREANAYAEGNRGQVREFEIPQESISNEKVVLDKINELGLQPKDKQYTVEESNLYELIDDRFDNSLSQADIKKLFNALKKDGVTAFRYKDGAQVIEGTTESIAVIDTDVVQKSVVKKQKGFSKQEAIRKAKEKYVLSVKERGNTPEQGVNSALEDLRKSEWYNEADDIMREEAERELKKFFGEKIKTAPSIKKVMAIKPTKIQVEEMAALKSQIRLEIKAAREAKGDLNAKRKAIGIAGMVRQGKITAFQARSIINKISKVNLDNPIMVERLINYADKVFERADYQETLSKAAKIRKSIKKAMKSKDLQAEVAGMAKKFSGVDPFFVEDIDQYIENAEKVLNAVRPVRETEVPLRKAADIEAISEYTTNQVELQEANKKAELLSLNKYLVDAGIVTDDMTAKEIQEMIDIIAAEEYEVENADKKLNFLKNRFDFMARVIEEMIVNNRDIFTDESLDLTQRQRDLMREVLKFNIDKLSVKQAAQVLEAMDNFINNGITSGLEAVIKNYIGNETANKLAASGLKSRPLKMYWNKAVGKFFGEQFVSLPLLVERMFPGINRGLKIMSDMGLTDLMRGVSKADRDHKMIVKDYTNQKFYKGKGFMKAENVYERGMIAFLSRNLAGTKTEMRNEFLRRIKMVEESINALMTGSDTERKMGEAYQKIYDKLKVNSQDLDVIKANAEKMNIEAVDWMTQQWAEKYSDLSDISLSVYNAILGSDTNYTPDRYKALEEANIELDENLLQKGSAFMGGLEYTDKNKSGVLIETTRPKVLPKGRFVSLDFDVNNFSSLKGAMIDIETAPAIRQVDGFIKSDGYKKIVNGDDRKILTRRINNYIISVKGKTSFNRDSMRSVERLANFLGSLGVGKALGGLDQTIKQTAPVIINTLINAGRFDGLDFEMNAAINRSGMPIANRGIEAISGVESVDALIDKKGATAAEIAKAIEKVSQMYMKVLLSKPDVWVARSSFISYYKNYLKTNGMSTNIDWKSHEWNQDALNYAQMMVDRQQNISDEKLAGSFMNSPDPWKSVTRKIMLPFATFIINQKNRMHNDLVSLFTSETSSEDKKKAARSLIGLSAEMLAYQGIAYFIKTMIYDNVASWITGEDDEEEKKERSFFGIKMTNKQWNATKFPVKSLVSDIVSPFPLFDDAVVFGFDELMSNFPMISDEDIKKAIQDQNDARALKGQDPMDAKQEANFIKNLKDKNTYAVAFQKESLGRQYGVPGIAFDTYTELADMAQLAYTGEFEDDMGFGPKKKYISKKDQEIVKWTLLPMMAYSTGLLPKDAGVVSRKVVNTIKKRSISETKFKNTNDLKKELGRKPKDWEESLVMNTTKKVPTIVDAIKFAERFGGLTESQGKEYAKLIEVTGDYGYLDLKRIQDGETADQILKK